MANRYAEDIRRIAGTDDISSTPDKNPEKDPIRGRRGIAYIKADGSIGGSSGESGETIPPSDAIGGENAPAKEGGSYGSNTSGSGVTVENEGGTTSDQPGDNNLGIIPAESLADGTAGVGDSFAGVELYDCGSGQKYIVRSDGQFTAPEGWSPDGPADFELGYYWAGVGSGEFATPSFSTRSQCHAWAAGLSDVYLSEDSSYQVSYCRPGYGYGCWYWFLQQCSPSEGSLTCPLSASEIVEDWPANSPAQLTWDAEQAAFLTSEYDTNVDQKYKDNNVGELNMCDSSGNPVQIQAGKDGGLVYTFSGGVVVVKDASGKIVAGVSLSNRDQYLAKQT